MTSIQKWLTLPDDSAVDSGPLVAAMILGWSNGTRISVGEGHIPVEVRRELLRAVKRSIGTLYIDT